MNQRVAWLEPARLAADIGGTFTDVVLETGARRYSCKVLTTARQPELGVLEGVRRLFAESSVVAAQVELFIHGTTLATNALIERKGARTALVTTEGFRDVLEMGFEKRFEQFDINIERPAELVPRPLRYTVRERVAADGSVLVPLDEAGVEHIAVQLIEQKIEAIAVGFLHAYAHPSHEIAVRDLLHRRLNGRATVCLSSEVCPEMREYERFSTTCANAYVRPLMAGYLTRLCDLLKAEGITSPLLLMMSGGGLTTLDYAIRFPIRLVESGPAGGAILAAHIAGECDIRDVMAFDMGGTTAKVCLINDRKPERSRHFEVGRAYRNLKGSGLPVRIPVIELVEIGAGGGSIGRVDALSRINVGPDSAGSEPGPACYSRGGIDATVTDANVQLGRIDPKRFAGGHIPLNADRASAALLARVGKPLELDAFWAAAGISEIVEENMANAARVHAIERGKVIADYTMVAFGGGAPLHAGRLAQKLGIRRIVVPSGAGVGSAIGFLRAPVSFEVVRSERTTLADCDVDRANARIAEMRQQALDVVGPAAGGRALTESLLVELRYSGQGHELRIPVETLIDRGELERIRERFEEEYERIYGLRIGRSEVDLVTWMLSLSTAPDAFSGRPSALEVAAQVKVAGFDRVQVWEPALGDAVMFTRCWRFDLDQSSVIIGPALIAEDETTTVVPAGWQARLDTFGHLLLDKQPRTSEQQRTGGPA